PAPHPCRYDDELWRAGAEARQARGDARCRPCKRRKPDRRCRALSSRRGQRWFADRLRRRPRPQALAAGAREETRMTAYPTSAARHAGPKLLILPNAWDPGSARVIESAGAKAIATSSAAVAWAHGFADGQHMPFETLLATVREISGTCSIPVSADIE